jgi:hypothetical protein
MTPAVRNALVNIAHIRKEINASLANWGAAGFKLGQLPSNTTSLTGAGTHRCRAA